MFFLYMKRFDVLHIKLCTGTYFKVTSELHIHKGTDGNESGFRLLTTPFKMF